MGMIRFDHVNVVRDNRKILNDINWHVIKGEHWAILGLNGSGKTTLLQLLNGYIWPSSGTLIVLGETFGKTEIPALRKRIGWVSSALQQQISPNDIAESIVLSGKFATIGVWALTTEAEKEKAQELLITVRGQGAHRQALRHLIPRPAANHPDCACSDGGTGNIDSG